MTDQKDEKSSAELLDSDLDTATGGATWGQGSVTSAIPVGGKDGLLIQNIGFPDDSGGSKIGDKSDVLLNPSRTYKLDDIKG